MLGASQALFTKTLVEFAKPRDLKFMEDFFRVVYHLDPTLVVCNDLVLTQETLVGLLLTTICVPKCL